MKPKILEFIENNTDSWEEKLNARLIRISVIQRCIIKP